MLTKDRLMRLCKAREQLRVVGTDELSIDEIAKATAMSRFHFVRQFKAVFGDTPVQLRTRARLDLAKKLLVHSERSITDICMSVGFSSLISFSTLFSRRFGRTPSMYRKQLSGFVEHHSPHCMTLMRTAWERKSQISRSRAAPD